MDDSPDRQPVGHLDTPVSGSPVGRGVTMVSGWVVEPGSPIDLVEIEVNGGAPVRARLGIVRDDAYELTGMAHARLSGFQALVDLSGLEGSTVTIVARVVGIGREHFVLDERTLELAEVSELSELSNRRRLERQRQLQAETHARLEEMTASLPAATEPLNLLVFSHDLNYGGAQIWLGELLERSGAGRDFPCTVIAGGSGPLQPRFEALGISVHVTSPYPVGDFEAYERSVAELAFGLCGGGHTAVLLNTFVSFIGGDVAGRLNLPYIWAIHESYEPSMILSYVYSPGEVDALVNATALRVLEEASKAVFVAEATRQLFLDVIDPARAVVVPYGVDTIAIDATRLGTSRAAARAQLGLSPDATVLLCAGVTEPRKAQTTTAEAFARITDDFPDVVLVFVGAIAAPYADGLRRYIDDMGLGDRCRVVPFVVDPSVWYLAADVFVCASDVESLPRTLLEAMCFEVPVLATAVFGVPEVIVDGQNGWLFESRSVKSAETAIRRVLGIDLPTRRAVAAAGCALVHERYDSRGYVGAVPAMLRAVAADWAVSREGCVSE